MKNHVSKAILLICCMLCTNLVFASEPNVTLTFETKNSKGETAILFQRSPFNKLIEVGRTAPDENGLLQFSFFIDKLQRFVIIYNNGKHKSTFFCKPDNNYRFYVNYDDEVLGDITNGNTDDVINIFVGEWNSRNDQFLFNGIQADTLRGAEKVAAFDYQETKMKAFLSDFISEYKPNESDKYFIENYSYNTLLGYRSYSMMKLKDYRDLREIAKSVELNRLFNSFTIEPQFLHISPADCALSLYYYYQFLLVKSSVEEYNIINYEDISEEQNFNFTSNIPNLSIPVEIKEQLLARQISDAVQSKEVYGELMPIMQANYPNSTYIPFLKSSFAKSHKLDGNLAPDVKGITVSGDSVNLSLLKGKVVYVDFWATWCGPCRAEFPKSIELKKQFEGRDDVVFMYVSVDEETDKWQKYVEEHPELKGLHINGRGDYREGFGKAYGIGGIPHYVLINKEGIVVESNAPRPSDERTAALIKKQF